MNEQYTEPGLRAGRPWSTASFDSDAVRRAVTAVSRCEVGEISGEETLLLRVDGGWGALAEVMVQADRGVLSDLLRVLFPAVTRGHWPDALAAQVILPCSLRAMPRATQLTGASGCCDIRWV